ncbi:MAG: hypothetical protein R3D98_01065 [Candidatus Krumholzibacteriia bacterium]
MNRAPCSRLLVVGLLAACLIGCGGPDQTIALDPSVQLRVRFGDPAWDGLEVPESGRCRDCGGQGRSPALWIDGVPAAAEEIVVEFNDLRIPDLARNGGHGTLAVATGGQDRVFLPSVREETMSLPRTVRCVRPHRCVFFGHSAGAYMAPCGCGHGNRYAATVMAVRHDGERTVVLARTEISLGVF